MHPSDSQNSDDGGGKSDNPHDGHDRHVFPRRPVIRGGLYGRVRSQPCARRGGSPTRRHEPADEWLDRRMREVFASWRSRHGQGALASVAIKQASEGYQWPHRKLGKRMREARRAQVNYQLVRAVGEVLIEYADLIYQRPPMWLDRAS